MQALERFVVWLAQHQHKDKRQLLPPGLVINYHARSDAHSKELGRLMVEDMVLSCPALSEQAADGRVAFGINYRHVPPGGKGKTVDIAIGVLKTPISPPIGKLIHEVLPRSGAIDYLLVSCEEKTAMTEHVKAQPRNYSELNDSHVIVHLNNRHTIAAGITMVNISPRFISALRQRRDLPVEVTIHNQPHAAQSLVQHLRGLPQRETVDAVGLDAYCSFVVDADNQGHVTLWETPPAPQPGDPDYYGTFLDRISRFYTERFSDLDHLPEPQGISVEDALALVAEHNPGTLEKAGQLAVDAGLAGAAELAAILSAVEQRVNPTIGDTE